MQLGGTLKDFLVYLDNCLLFFRAQTIAMGPSRFEVLTNEVWHSDMKLVGGIFSSDALHLGFDSESDFFEPVRVPARQLFASR